MKTRREYVRCADSKLQEYREQVAEMERHASNLRKEGNKAGSGKTCEKMREQMQRLEESVLSLKRAPEEEWEAARKTVETQWDKLNHLLADARSGMTPAS